MDSYYKLRQLFYYKVRYGLFKIAMDLLRMRQVLQSAMIITNCESTYGNTK